MPDQKARPVKKPAQSRDGLPADRGSDYRATDGHGWRGQSTYGQDEMEYKILKGRNGLASDGFPDIYKGQPFQDFVDEYGVMHRPAPRRTTLSDEERVRLLDLYEEEVLARYTLLRELVISGDFTKASEAARRTLDLEAVGVTLAKRVTTGGPDNTVDKLVAVITNPPRTAVRTAWEAVVSVDDL